MRRGATVEGDASEELAVTWRLWWFWTRPQAIFGCASCVGAFCMDRCGSVALRSVSVLSRTDGDATAVWPLWRHFALVEARQAEIARTR